MPTAPADIPSELLTDFDIYDPALAAPVDRVQEELAALAKRGPVLFSRKHGGHWIVLGYDEVHEVMRDAERFSSYPNNIMPHGGEKTLPLELDPPEHTAYRHALQPLFSPTRMRALEEQVRTTVTELLDGFAARGEAEFVAEFAHELPARVFLSLMDLPLSDAPLFTEATNTYMLGKPDVSEEESNAAREDAVFRMWSYFGDVIAERRARPVPGDDVTSQIIFGDVTIDGTTRKFTDAELQNMFFLLLIAGLHTVQGSLGWAVVHLTANPEHQKSLTADPDRIPTAVEEILRIEAAVHPGRRVTQDTMLGGVQLRAGDQLLLSLAAANRDGRQFDAPENFDGTREPNRHLSFGSGPHRCLGSHLARVELRIALEELHRRIPDYRVAPDAVTLWHASQVRGVLQLPIVFTPEA